MSQRNIKINHEKFVLCPKTRVMKVSFPIDQFPLNLLTVLGNGFIDLNLLQEVVRFEEEFCGKYFGRPLSDLWH